MLVSRVMLETAAEAEAESMPGTRDYAAIFLVSCAILLFQITLTRVLSVVVWYHFAFLTISMVMLGLGVPGVWFALMRQPQRWLPHCLLASGIAVPVAVVFIVKLGTLFVIEKQSVQWSIVAVLPAMLALGSAICLLLMRAGGRSITRMYGIDLLGACHGAVSVVPLMHFVPPISPRPAASFPFWRCCCTAGTGGAGTPITQFDGDLRKVEFLNYDISTFGYQLRPPDRVAIVGGGGGRDIVSALLLARTTSMPSS